MTTLGQSCGCYCVKAFTVMQALLSILLLVFHPILFPPEEGQPHSALSTVNNRTVCGRCGLQQSDQECPSRRRKGFRMLAEMLCVLESP